MLAYTDTGTDLWLTDEEQVRRAYPSAPTSDAKVRAWVMRLGAGVQVPSDRGGPPRVIAYRPVADAELKGDTGLAADERRTMHAHAQRWSVD
jgi:hypothetical protein